MGERPDSGWRGAIAPRGDGGLTRLRLPRDVTETHVTNLLAGLDGLLLMQQPFAVVLELDDELVMSAALRRTLARSLADRRTGIRARCAAMAIVARTPTALGVHTALRWLAEASCPERVFGSAVDAETWARGLCGAGGGGTK